MNSGSKFLIGLCLVIVLAILIILLGSIGVFGPSKSFMPQAAKKMEINSVLWRISPDKAFEEYSDIIRREPHNDDAYCYRGLALTNLKKHDEAKKDFEKAVELNAKNELAVYNHGLGWARKGYYDKAISDYNKALELNPKSVDAYNSRGNAWANKKDLSKAIKDYDTALQMSFDYALKKDSIVPNLNRSVESVLSRHWMIIINYQALPYKPKWKAGVNQNVKYEKLFGYFSAKLSMDNEAAEKFLLNSSPEEWPDSVYSFLKSTIDESEFLRLSKRMLDLDIDDRRYFLGVYYATNDEIAKSIINFREFLKPDLVLGVDVDPYREIARSLTLRGIIASLEIKRAPNASLTPRLSVEPTSGGRRIRSR